MKKLLITGLICALSIFFTGCTKTTCDIEINSNNEISITNTQGVKLQNQMLPKGFYEVLERDMNKIIKKYSTEETKLSTYINDYSAGVVSKNEKLNFKEATKKLPAGYSATEDEAFEIDKKLFKTTYKINMIYNPITASKYVPEYYEEFKKSSETAQKFGNKIVAFASQNIVMDNTSSNDLIVKIPRKASKNNATEKISNNEYRWVFEDDKKPVIINLEYNEYSFWPF